MELKDSLGNLIEEKRHSLSIYSAISWEELISNYEAPQDGNLNIYIDNSSSDKVYFDEFTIEKTEATKAVIVQENHYYPFGMNMKGIEELDLQSIEEDDEHRWQFNGVEKNESFGLNWNETFYRTYDYQLGRWNHIDPKPTYSQTTYMGMGNNPIYYNDVKGDTGTGDLAAYNNVKGYVQNEIGNYSNKITNMQNTIASRQANGQSINRQTRILNDLIAKRQEYQEVLNEFKALEDSRETYNIITNANNVPLGAGGLIEYNNQTGHIDVKTGTSLPLLEALPHELKHAYQYETGKLSLGYNGKGGSLYDIQDEVEAYSRSQLFGFYSGLIINEAFVRTRGYATLSSNQITESTIVDPSMINSPTFGGQIKQSIYTAGQKGINPREVIKDWDIIYALGKLSFSL